MSDGAIAFSALIGVAAVLWIVWRESRSDKWNAGGRCYQCGETLGFDFKTVTRRYKGGSSKRVDFCARCASHRLIWGWLVLGMVILFAALMWYHMSHAA
jgi:hypothetical protein